jgi:competence protein ComEA
MLKTGVLVAIPVALVAAIGLSVGVRARQEPSDGQAEETFKATCVKCHTPERIMAARKTRTQWEETIDKMTKLGATVTDEDFETVIDYLLRHSGKVNVNKAVEKDLVLVLAITKAEAEAVVAYRKTNGDFTDLDALTKVPGIDAEKLQKNKDAIAF